MKYSKVAIGVSLFTLSQSLLAYTGTSGDDTHTVSNTMLDSQYLMGSGNDTLELLSSTVSGSVSISMGSGQDRLSILDLCSASGAPSVSIEASYSNPFNLNLSNQSRCTYSPRYSLAADIINLDSDTAIEWNGAIAEFNSFNANELILDDSLRGILVVGSLNISDRISGTAPYLSLALSDIPSVIPSNSDFSAHNIYLSNDLAIDDGAKVSLANINSGSVTVGRAELNITDSINANLFLKDGAVVNVDGSINVEITGESGSSATVSSESINGNVTMGPGSRLTADYVYGNTINMGDNSTFTLKKSTPSDVTIGDNSAINIDGGCFGGAITIGEGGTLNGANTQCQSNGSINAGNDSHINFGFNSTNGRIEIGDRSSYITSGASGNTNYLNAPLIMGDDSEAYIGQDATSGLTMGENSIVTVLGNVSGNTLMGSGSTLSAKNSYGEITAEGDASITFSEGTYSGTTITGIAGNESATFNLGSNMTGSLTASNLFSLRASVEEIRGSGSISDVGFFKLDAKTQKSSLNIIGSSKAILNYSEDVHSSISMDAAESAINFRGMGNSGGLSIQTGRGVDFVKQTTDTAGLGLGAISLGGGNDTLVVSLSTDNLIASFNSRTGNFDGGEGNDSLYLPNVSSSDAEFSTLQAQLNSRVVSFENIYFSDASTPSSPDLDEGEGIDQAAGVDGGSDGENLLSGKYLFIMSVPELEK